MCCTPLKPLSNWTNHELDAYNIAIQSLPPEHFFSDRDQSLDHIDPAILNLPAGIHLEVSADAGNFFGYLHRATHREDHCGKSYIVDFVWNLLKFLGFEKLHSDLTVGIVTYEVLPFILNGNASYTAPMDVCLLHWTAKQDFVLVIFANGPEAQVVATAIAAFQANNRTRRQLGLNPLDKMTIPCFNMTGKTRPTFYLVPVTAELSTAVITGQYPAVQTRALRCETASINEQSERTGMEDPEYRRLALKHFIAFRELARSHWERIVPRANDTSTVSNAFIAFKELALSYWERIVPRGSDTLDRSPKPAKEWTDHELEAYNITSTSLPPDNFFPTLDQPLDHLDPGILSFPVGTDHPDMSVDARHFLASLNIATHQEDHSEKSYIIAFVDNLLELLDFNEPDSDLHIGLVKYENLPFAINGNASYTAPVDVCLFHWIAKEFCVLVIFANGSEAQAVATAIAAFRSNNRARRQLGLNPLNEMTFPCFNMTGKTRPTFYLVPVTAELSTAVITGQYPAVQTRVLRCETAPINEQSERMGMEDPEYRRLALKRFIAFRELARSHWEDMLEGFDDVDY